MQTKSIRFSDELLREITTLEPKATFSEVVIEAVERWIAQRRRDIEDSQIKDALVHTPSKQKAEVRKLAETAGDSARRIMERLDG